MSIDLASLARSAATDDERRAGAEEALCAHFRPILHLYGRRHLGDASAAEDLAQDTLASALTALRQGRLEDPEKLGSFVFGVAKNKLREAQRARVRARRIADAMSGPSEVEPILVGFRMYLFGCLSQLTEQARAVLERSYYRDENAVEIAEALSLSHVHVRVIRHRALGALRRCLEGSQP